MKILWSGEFFSHFSLAIVNRRLVNALLERGNVDIAIHSDPSFERHLPERFRRFAELARRDPRGADVNVVNALWPLRFGAPGDARYVRILPWEFGAMPREWFDDLHDDCDDIWAPTTYNRDIFVNDGIAPDRAFVVPHGVDTRIFRPDGHALPSAPETFHFLYVGATIPRKGIDILVNAYLRAFTPRDRVCLTIKDVNAHTYYAGNTVGAKLAELARTSNIPRIAYVDETYEESGIASLYRAVNCLVLPYRGEGFGMPVLEAMACGVPVIVSDGGATDDFVDESVGWRVAAPRVNCPPGMPVPTVSAAWLLEPDIDVLAKTMRYAYENPDDLARRGKHAAERAKEWTWDRAATIVEQRCRYVCERPAVPPKRRAQRYADPHTYEEQRFGPSNIDGILLEIFRRLGVQDPIFAELNGEGTPVICAPFERMQWKGIARTRAVAPSDLPENLDLLALDYDASAIWRTLPHPPRVVACSAGAFPALRKTAAQLGYVHLATESVRGDAVFLRQDLLSRASFSLDTGLKDPQMFGVPVADLHR